MVFLLLAVVTHLPSLIRTEALNPDEAFLATEAQVLNDGGHLYHDVVDRKPPIVPYVYAAVSRVTGSDDLVGVRVLAHRYVRGQCPVASRPSRDAGGATEPGSPPGSCIWSRVVVWCSKTASRRTSKSS